MIWVSWWISRSSFSRSICPPSWRSAPLVCGDHMSFRSPPLFTIDRYPRAVGSAGSADAAAIATKPYGNVGLQIRVVSLQRKGDSVRWV